MAGELKTRISITGDAEVRRALDALGAAGDAAMKRISASGKQVDLDKVKQSAEELKAALDSVGQSSGGVFSGLANAINSAASGLGSLAGGIVDVGVKAGIAIGALAVAATAATGAMATAAAKSVSDISAAAEALGLTITQYQRLKAAAEGAGVSSADLTAGLSGLKKAYDDAAAGAAKFRDASGNTVKIYEDLGVKVVSAGSKIGEVAAGPGQKAIDFFSKLGVSVYTAGNALKPFPQVIAEAQAAFSRLPASQQRALESTAGFGQTIRQLKDYLAASGKDLKEYERAWDASGRGITKSEEKVAAALVSAQDDLSSALQATRDKVGLLFAPGKTQTTEFFTRIVDGSREAILAFVRLQQAAAKAFAIENGPAFLTFFKQVGTTIGSLRETAVPAIKELVSTVGSLVSEGFNALAAELTKLTGINITGEFLKAGAAITYLTSGFSALTLVSTPVIATLTVVAGLLTGFGPLSVVAGLAVVAFWDELVAGGTAAAKVFAGSGAAFKTLVAQVRAGDFSGAFKTLKQIGLDAFQALEKEAPKLGEFAREISLAFSKVGTTIKSVFSTVLAVLDVVAVAFNALFGTDLTGKSVAVYLALAQVTGALGAVAAISFIAANVFRILGLQGVILAAAFVVVARVFREAREALGNIGEGFVKFLKGDFAEGLEQMRAGFAEFFGVLGNQGPLAWAIFAAGALIAFAKIRAGLIALGLISGGTSLAAGVASAVGGVGTAAAVGAAATAAGAGIGAALVAAVLGVLAIGLTVGVVEAIRRASAEVQSKEAQETVAARREELNTNLNLIDEARKEMESRLAGNPPKLPGLNLADFSASLEQANAKVADTLTPALADLSDRARGALDSTARGATDVLGSVNSGLSAVFRGLSDASGKIGQVSKDAFSAAAEGAAALTPRLTEAEAAARGLPPALAAGRKAAEDVAEGLNKAATAASGTVKVFGGVGGSVREFAVGVDGAAPALKTTGDAAEKTSGQVDGLIRVIKGGKTINFPIDAEGNLKKIGDAAEATTEKVKGKLGEVGTKGQSVTEQLSALFDKLWKELGVGGDEATKKAGEGIEGLKAKFADVGAAGDAAFDKLGEAATEAGGKFSDSLDKLRESSNIEDRRGGGGSGDQWEAFIENAANAFETVGKAFVDFLAQLLDQGNSGFSQLFDRVGQNWTAFLTQFFTIGSNGFANFLTLLADAFKETFDTIGTSAKASLADGIGAAVKAAVDSVPAALSAIAPAFTDAFAGAVAAVTASLSQIEAAVAGMVASIQGQLSALNASIQATKDAAASIDTGGGGSEPGGGFAAGGHVTGPGTSTSDSILSWLSNNEFVIRAAAVSKYGTGFLHAINSLSMPRNFLPRFARGGPVSVGPLLKVPRFAQGGSVAALVRSLVPSAGDAFAPAGGAAGGAALRPVYLSIGNESFGPMLTDEAVASRLERYATSARVRSAGSAPGWKR